VSENLTVPKSVSICSPQNAPDTDVHTEGGSTIHSAEAVPGEVIVNVFEKLVPRLMFRIRIVTRMPRTKTEAEIVSLGATLRGTWTQEAGTSSYHAK